jgi:hypothetical protein
MTLPPMTREAGGAERPRYRRKVPLEIVRVLDEAAACQRRQLRRRQRHQRNRCAQQAGSHVRGWVPHPKQL